jgi:hypothetical protein
MYCTRGLSCVTSYMLYCYMQYTVFLLIYNSMSPAIFPSIDLSVSLFICHHKLLNVYLPFVGPFYAKRDYTILCMRRSTMFVVNVLSYILVLSLFFKNLKNNRGYRERWSRNIQTNSIFLLQITSQ